MATDTAATVEAGTTWKTKPKFIPLPRGKDRTVQQPTFPRGGGVRTAGTRLRGLVFGGLGRGGPHPFQHGLVRNPSTLFVGGFGAGDCRAAVRLPSHRLAAGIGEQYPLLPKIQPLHELEATPEQGIHHQHREY